MQEEDLTEQDCKSIVSHMVMVHESVRAASTRFQEQLRRYNYVTPKNYLDFIHNYRCCTTCLPVNECSLPDATALLCCIVASLPLS